MADPKTRDELYQIYKTEVQTIRPALTDFSEGSINDALAGATATAIHELVNLLIDRFGKTFFKSSNGPEVTGGADDLETLATDHFGDDFARPGETAAVGVVTFSRPTALAGDVTIPAGTVVKTAIDALGSSKRYETAIEVVLTGLSINASIEALDDTLGVKGNVGIGEIDTIESALTDPSVEVTNADEVGGGEDEEDDATYRETIFNLIRQLKGATKEALEAKLKTVPGIVKATVVEFIQTVIEYDVANDLTIGDSFKIARAKAFIADANGSANAALIANASLSLDPVRACGVKIDVFGATPFSLNWTAEITLNPSGPNYPTLSVNTSLIVDAMTKYLEDLDIGSDFIRATANDAIMAIWGPSGSNDLTSFGTTIPSGDVATVENERIIPGTVEIN